MILCEHYTNNYDPIASIILNNGNIVSNFQSYTNSLKGCKDTTNCNNYISPSYQSITKSSASIITTGLEYDNPKIIKGSDGSFAVISTNYDDVQDGYKQGIHIVIYDKNGNIITPYKNVPDPISLPSSAPPIVFVSYKLSFVINPTPSPEKDQSNFSFEIKKSFLKKDYFYIVYEVKEDKSNYNELTNDYEHIVTYKDYVQKYSLQAEKIGDSYLFKTLNQNSYDVDINEKDHLALTWYDIDPYKRLNLFYQSFDLNNQTNITNKILVSNEEFLSDSKIKINNNDFVSVCWINKFYNGDEIYLQRFEKTGYKISNTEYVDSIIKDFKMDMNDLNDVVIVTQKENYNEDNFILTAHYYQKNSTPQHSIIFYSGINSFFLSNYKDKLIDLSIDKNGNFYILWSYLKIFNSFTPSEYLNKDIPNGIYLKKIDPYLQTFFGETSLTNYNELSSEDLKSLSVFTGSILMDEAQSLRLLWKETVNNNNYSILTRTSDKDGIALQE